MNVPSGRMIPYPLAGFLLGLDGTRCGQCPGARAGDRPALIPEGLTQGPCSTWRRSRSAVRRALMTISPSCVDAGAVTG